MKIYQNFESAIESIRPFESTFIVKQFITRKLCDDALNEIEGYLKKYESNERFFGENWHYKVKKHDTEFYSFIFNSLDALPQGVLLKIYEKIFNAYKQLGDDISNDFAFHLQQNVKGKTINPLVFWYPHGVGKFDWHQHPPTWQKFQLLINLTQPSVDYDGGHTHIELDKNNIEVFDHNFKKGDMFCFPYTKWHKVDPILKGSVGNSSKRVSLLMPLHPRIPVDIKLRSKDGLIYD